MQIVVRWDNRKCTHPRSAKDVPILNLEVLAKAFDVLDQVPGRVLLEARAPAHTNKQSVDGSEARGAWSDARRGLSGSALIQEDHLQCKMVLEELGMKRAKVSPDLVLLGIEEAAILLVASSAGTTSVRG
jgi:hypothetical protein